MHVTKTYYIYEAYIVSFVYYTVQAAPSFTNANGVISRGGNVVTGPPISQLDILFGNLCYY